MYIRGSQPRLVAPRLPLTQKVEDMTKPAGTNGQLKAFVERIERVAEEKDALTKDIKEIYGEAKGNGYDTKTLRKAVALRKQDKDERQVEADLLDLYLQELGML